MKQAPLNDIRIFLNFTRLSLFTHENKVFPESDTDEKYFTIFTIVLKYFVF